MIYDYMINSFLSNPGCKLTSGNRKKVKAMYQNNMTFRAILSHLIDLYMYSIHIKVKGSDEPLPPGISERIIKLSILFNDCVIFTDGVKWNGEYYPGKYAFMGYPSGKGWNLKGNPLSAFIYSMYNGLGAQEIPLNVEGMEDAPAIGVGFSGQKADKEPKGYIVWGHESRFPMFYMVLYYATCLTDCMRTLDVTRFWLKRPVIFTADKELVNSINNVIEHMELNEEWTIQGAALGDVGQNTNLLNPNVNGQNLKDVTGLYEWYLSKYKEFIGIDSNAQMDKKGENLQTAEITVNDEYQHDNIDMMVQTMNAGFDENAPFYGVALEAEARTGNHTAVGGTYNKDGDNDGDGLRDISDVDR